MRLLLTLFVGIIIGSAGTLTSIWLAIGHYEQPTVSVSDLTPRNACFVPDDDASRTTKDEYQACLNRGGVSIRPPQER
jgi:hypothetical protein